MTYVSDSTPICFRGRDYIVRRRSIIGTPTVIYETWEALDGHSTLRPTERIGSVPSRRLPTVIDVMPFGPARMRRVEAWQAAVNAEAISVICAVYPDVMAQPHARIEGGTISTAENLSAAA